MRSKIDVMEREWKNLEFGGDLNQASEPRVYGSCQLLRRERHHHLGLPMKNLWMDLEIYSKFSFASISRQTYYPIC